MNAYRMTVIVVDHEDMGEQAIRDLLKDSKYLSVRVAPIAQVLDLGEWRDDHPLSLRSADAWFTEALAEKVAHNIVVTAALDEKGTPIEALSGRMRHRVVCTTCNVLVHEATTGPEFMAQAHRDGGASYERPLESS